MESVCIYHLFVLFILHIPFVLSVFSHFHLSDSCSPSVSQDSSPCFLASFAPRGSGVIYSFTLCVCVCVGVAAGSSYPPGASEGLENRSFWVSVWVCVPGTLGQMASRFPQLIIPPVVLCCPSAAWMCLGADIICVRVFSCSLSAVKGWMRLHFVSRPLFVCADNSSLCACRFFFLCQN